MNIKDFLLARIDEDEEEVAYPAEWERVGGYRYVDVGGLNDVLTVGTDRVLAECAAKRAIVERHSSCDDVSYGDASTCPEMRNLAAIYADHPDCQKEWVL